MITILTISAMETSKLTSTEIIGEQALKRLWYGTINPT
jgi:hypothetical protein